MSGAAPRPLNLVIHICDGFNLAATSAFLDPFRAANYLAGRGLFRWRLTAASAGPVASSSGLALVAEAVEEGEAPDLAVVSASWTPERHYGRPLSAVLRRWSRFGAALAGLDTGAFILAANGLLDGRRATVHYEHMDAFIELYPKVDLVEDLFVIDDDRMTAAGGAAAADLALHIVRRGQGDALANAAARYVFHPELRPEGAPQNPAGPEPLGAAAPAALRAAIRIMEGNLEEPARIPEICAEIGVGQRRLERMFAAHVGKTPLLYYRDIRLDRARGLVTQTEMPIAEVALACGFATPVQFSRAYKARFGLAPRKDRVEGRTPFEFRAWPMYRSAAEEG